jgi:hypothetical protein
VYTETANFWRSGTQSRLSNLQNLILLSRWKQRLISVATFIAKQTLKTHQKYL